MYLMKTYGGNYIIGVQEDRSIGTGLQTGGDDNVVYAFKVLTLAKRGRKTADLNTEKMSTPALLEYRRMFPHPKLQHRKVFKDDSIVSAHSKWHEVGGVDCNHTEAEARKVIAYNGGVIDAGYCLNMFRELPA